MEFKCLFRSLNVRKEFKYACIVKTVETHGSEVEFIDGSHQQHYNDDDVQAFLIANKPLESFPLDLTSFYPYLSHLRIIECGMLSITREDLKEFELLVSLDLSNNKLKTLPDNLLEGMFQLRRISFAENDLESFSSAVLKPVSETLEFADFRRNKNISEWFESPHHSTFERLCETIDALCQPTDKSLKTIAVKAASQSRAFESQFLSGKFSDITFCTVNKKYNVHKNILAAQSPIFDRLFEECDEIIYRYQNDIFPFISDHVVEEFFRFFYTGSIKYSANVMELLAMSVDFDVPILHSLCLTTIEENMDKDNALEMFDYAVEKNHPKLKRAAFEILKTNHPEVTERLYDEPWLVKSIAITFQLSALLDESD